jgi:hypothetical protein
MKLLTIIKKPIFRDGNWQLLEPVPAWEGNGTWDSFIAFAWTGKDGKRVLVAANYASHHSQCYLKLPFPELAGQNWRLQDLLGDACFERDGNDIHSKGLYLDMQPWQFHLLEINSY